MPCNALFAANRIIVLSNAILGWRFGGVPRFLGGTAAKIAVAVADHILLLLVLDTPESVATEDAASSG